MRSARTVMWFGTGVIVLNLTTTAVAVIANWPTQFGRVGVDAKREFVASGTAISAPLLPVLVLVVSVALIAASPRRASIGVGGVGLVCAVMAIGGLGEFFAPATVDTPRAVLVAGGIGGSVIGLTGVCLAASSLRAVRRRRAQRPAEPVGPLSVR